MGQQILEQNISEMWAMLREDRDLLRENRIQLELLREQTKETERLLHESSLKTDHRFQETERLIREESLKTDQQIQELREQMAQTDLYIKQTYGWMSDRWGRLVEALVEPGVAALFQSRNIEVTGTASRIIKHRDGETVEVDALLTNGDTVMIVEVKTTVSHQDVTDLLNDLARFSHFFPEYRDYKLYGAIAGLKFPPQVGRAAYRRGLFVVTLTGQGLVEIKNDLNFKPKNFGAGSSTD